MSCILRHRAFRLRCFAAWLILANVKLMSLSAHQVFEPAAPLQNQQLTDSEGEPVPTDPLESP